MNNNLQDLVRRNRSGQVASMVSVCSAHPDVLRASLNWAERGDRLMIIETTSNQVNQDGGYMGLTPQQFTARLWTLADRLGISRHRLVLGGDHLGTQGWRHLPPSEAMAKAKRLVADYVEAGFEKIHLDCSQGCQGEPHFLSDQHVAQRSAELALACEQGNKDQNIAYVIGTEVPIPGGAQNEEPAEHEPEPTSPQAARATLEAHDQAFDAVRLSHIKDQTIGLVVQPGVEFEPMNLHHLPLTRDPGLRDVARSWPNLCLEAHSTDYQQSAAFHRLAELGFAFQKVGPALTFALRQALYSLDMALSIIGRGVGLADTMEQIMLDDPGYWQGYYAADDRIARHFGLSDRIRYYWNTQMAQAAIKALNEAMAAMILPDPLLRQCFSERTLERAERLRGPQAQRLIDAQIELALDPYDLTDRRGKHD